MDLDMEMEFKVVRLRPSKAHNKIKLHPPIKQHPIKVVKRTTQNSAKGLTIGINTHKNK